MKKKPKRLFRARQSEGWKQVVDGMIVDPATRAAFYQAFESLDHSEMNAVWSQIPQGDRAGLMLAMKDAIFHLRDRKPCDLCDSTATRIRPQAVYPDDDFRGVKREDDRQGFFGYAVVCDAHAAMPAAAFRRAMLDHLARLQKDRGYTSKSHRRVTLIGDRVGETGPLAPRAVLETCEGCSATVWIDRDERTRLAGPIGEPCFLCRQCARSFYEAGRLEGIPELFIPEPFTA